MKPQPFANSSLSALAQAAWTWVQEADTQALGSMVVMGEMKWPL
ncbi:hypothetical protein [Uliginosibacterium gangwonense]|nr:hypothetical protein [Uliginosibacterium gangwonense]